MAQKHLFGFLLINTIILASFAIPECPSEDDPSNPILYPDPTDCGGFLECAQGSLVQLKCYPGLYYNQDPTKQYCDYKANVDCGDRPTTTVAPPTSSSPATPPTSSSTTPPTTPPTSSPTTPTTSSPKPPINE